MKNIKETKIKINILENTDKIQWVLFDLLEELLIKDPSDKIRIVNKLKEKYLKIIEENIPQNSKQLTINY